MLVISTIVELKSHATVRETWSIGNKLMAMSSMDYTNETNQLKWVRPVADNE